MINLFHTNGTIIADNEASEAIMLREARELQSRSKIEYQSWKKGFSPEALKAFQIEKRKADLIFKQNQRQRGYE